MVITTAPTDFENLTEIANEVSALNPDFETLRSGIINKRQRALRELEDIRDTYAKVNPEHILSLDNPTLGLELKNNLQKNARMTITINRLIERFKRFL